jgi:hypothetical protein
MTRSASLRRSRMARVADAMWPGNQFIAPPLELNPISATRFPARATPPILIRCKPAISYAARTCLRWLSQDLERQELRSDWVGYCPDFRVHRRRQVGEWGWHCGRDDVERAGIREARQVGINYRQIRPNMT